MHSDKYTINMNVLSAVSRLSWRAIREDYSIKQFERELNKIRKMKPQYPAWAVTLGTSLGCGGFSVLFGGDWASFVPATIAGAVAYVVRYFMLKRGFNFYMVTSMTSFVATLTAWLLFPCLTNEFHRLSLSFIPLLLSLPCAWGCTHQLFGWYAWQLSPCGLSTFCQWSAPNCIHGFRHYFSGECV